MLRRHTAHSSSSAPSTVCSRLSASLIYEGNGPNQSPRRARPPCTPGSMLSHRPHRSPVPSPPLSTPGPTGSLEHTQSPMEAPTPTAARGGPGVLVGPPCRWQSLNADPSLLGGRTMGTPLRFPKVSLSGLSAPHPARLQSLKERVWRRKPSRCLKLSRPPAVSNLISLAQ